MDLKNNKARIDIIEDAEGKNIVIINDIRFKGRQGINWKEVEGYLKEYIGKYYEILETSEKVYIGSDFPDEFSHSNDTRILKGANAKAKANATQAIGELIQIASNRTYAEDYSKKHKNRAMNGWYRYDSRFALPVYTEEGALVRYNVFSVRLLIRHDKDQHMYLYDILRTKKETGTPLEQ